MDEHQNFVSDVLWKFDLVFLTRFSLLLKSQFLLFFLLFELLLLNSLLFQGLLSELILKLFLALYFVCFFSTE